MEPVKFPDVGAFEVKGKDSNIQMSRLPINDASPILNSSKLKILISLELDYNNLRFGDDFGTDRKGISSHAPSNFDKSTKERKTPKVDFDKLEKMSGMSTLMDGYDDDDSDDAPPPLGPKAAMPANQV